MSVTGELVIPRNTVEKTDYPSGGKNESDGEEWLERGHHPLVIDLILETLFGFVRRCDLKACRIVSKKWNLHTIPHMRATFRLTIHESQSTGEGNQNTRGIDDFVNLFSANVLKIPFLKFKFGPFHRTGAGQQFLQLCGESATEIDFDGRNTIEDVSEILRQCPNLEDLGFPSRLNSFEGNVAKLFPDSFPTFSCLKRITFHHNKNGIRRKHCPSAIKEILTAAPNVTDIIASDVPRRLISDNGDYDDNIGVVLNCIEKLGRESSIQSLHLHNARGRHIEHLRRMNEKENGLKLKNLTFKKYKHSQENFGSQIQLATIFKHTLESLNLDLVHGYNLMFYPSMLNLKSLTLKFKHSTSTAPRPVNLTHKFPALEKLEIGFENDWEDLSDFFSRFESSPTIKFLIVCSRKMKIQTFNDILRVFPNLTKLNVRVGEDGSEIVGKIWTHLTGLKSLAISGFFAKAEDLRLDSLFTGIPTQTLQGIRHVVNEVEKMNVQGRKERILELMEQHSERPSIRSLTQLKKLYLDVDEGKNWNSRIQLTDLTVYLAFYSLSHLRHLNMKFCMFTKTCCEILTRETGLETWRFRNTEYENIIPPFVLPEHENDYNNDYK